jgi:GT2 family glycosyltransferase
VAARGDGVTGQIIYLTDVAAVVVHHRSYDTLPMTVRGLVAQGLEPARIVVVDNSEEPDRRTLLERSLPSDVQTCYVANRGYGAGVNAGLDFLRSRGDDARYVLVSSHESRPDGAAIARLREALEQDPTAAVAGPTLVTGEGSNLRTWSEGGYLAPVTHRPRHHGYQRAVSTQPDQSPVPRQWLDGAFLLYRCGDLERFRFSEDYFLYMEETDLHLRLGRAGRTALWVPSAVAWQSSHGVPAYWFARNLRLLYARNDRAWRRALIARALTLRRLAGAVARGRAGSEAVALLKGSTVRLPPPPRVVPPRTFVVNPLAAALHHYQAELLTVLEDVDTTAVLSFPEPSTGVGGRVSWLVRYVAALARAGSSTRRSKGRLLVVWPVLGYLDLVLLRTAAGRRASLVVHDPVPLVKALGYGKPARRLGMRLGAGVRVIVHSEAARRALDPALPNALVSILPHPIRPPQERSAPATDRASRPVIRVLGQYKVDRDLAALSAVAERFRDSAVLEVHGRGWPGIDGWVVQPHFVSESNMDELIASSDVVLIPYRRFFQSGIAIRCLEHGIPVVGPARSSLEDLYGSNSPLLVTHPDDWARAVAHALSGGREEAVAAAGRWWTRARAAWSDWRAR